MLSSTNRHHEENDDELEDIETLRRIAMESINNKKSKEAMQIAHRPRYQSQPTDNVYSQPYHNNSANSFPPNHQRMPHNFMAPRYMTPQNAMNFGAQPFVPPFHPRANQPLMHPDFSPMPHLNPQFMPPLPQIFPNDYQPAGNMDFVPTPAIRLSPRTLEFVESNKKALMNANSKKRSNSPNGRRRYSRGSRSRSRSPIRHRQQYNKRYRSKSPNNSYNYKNRKLASGEKDRSAAASPNRYPKKGRDNNNTRYSNGTKFDRIRSESDKDDDESIQSSQKSSQSEKEVKKLNDSIDEANESIKSLSPIPEEIVTVKKESPSPPEKQKQPGNKEKTQDEIENELLASTDDEAEVDIELEVGADELDFFDMDDSESENEGRFKDKPSTNTRKEEKSSVPKNSISYSAKGYNNSSKSYNKSSRDDKYKRDYTRRNSPDRKKSPKYGSKDEALFKSTFKSIESSEKRDNFPSKRSENKASLVRSTVIKPESNSKSSIKSVISTSEETSKPKSDSRKRKILDRLGEFVGAKTKSSEVSKSLVSSKQVIPRHSRFKRIKRQVVMKINAISN